MSDASVNLSVRTIQQALVVNGDLRASNVTGRLDSVTRSALAVFSQQAAPALGYRHDEFRTSLNQQYDASPGVLTTIEVPARLGDELFTHYYGRREASSPWRSQVLPNLLAHRILTERTKPHRR